MFGKYGYFDRISRRQPDAELFIRPDSVRLLMGHPVETGY